MTVGQSVVCSASGNPPPTVILYLRRTGGDWEEKSSGTDRVSFFIAKEEEEGEVAIKCKATNSEGTKDKEHLFTVRSECEVCSFSGHSAVTSCRWFPSFQSSP